MNKKKQPQPTDFYDDTDPRGMSTSEWEAYSVALEKWKGDELLDSLTSPWNDPKIISLREAWAGMWNKDPKGIYFLKPERITYIGNMDKECIELCDALNSIDAIQTIESCCGHDNEPFQIWFSLDFKTSSAEKSLFFLTRCMDRRYWKHGHKWSLSMTVGDSYDGQHLPAHFHISSNKVKGKKAYKQAKNLVQNMNYHLNHKNFMEAYDLDLSTFSITSEILEML